MRRTIITTICLAATGTAVAAHADPEVGDPGNIFDTFIVPNNDDVSFRLKAVSLNNEKDLFSTVSGNPASVGIHSSGMPQSVGASTSGNFDVLVGWDEFFENAPGQGEASRLRFEITTSSGGSLISQDDFDNGFNFIRWEIGDHNDPADSPFADPIDFRSTVTQVTLVEATAVFFEDNTVLNTVDYGFTLGIGSDWNGTDAEIGNIFMVDSAVNRIQITYDYTPIPAPAGIATLVGAGLIATRRRR